VILVDTSVWIDHLRVSNSKLVQWLGEGAVLTHPFVIGELALGNLRNRAVILDALRQLPRAVAASNDEVLTFIEAQRLYGLGVGHVDVHLLASVRLSGGVRLWTRDRRLATVAEGLGVAVEPFA
jgi:predicted nucleic acid-binding protein